MLAIRPATPADAPRIAEILVFVKRAAYRHIFYNDAYSFGELQVVSLANELVSTKDMLNGMFVYDDEFVKGMASISVTVNESGKIIFELKQLYVDTFFQNSGIGAALFKFAEEKCVEAKADEMILWVLEKNSTARNFYEKHGLAFNGTKCFEEGTTEYLLQYSKKTNA